MGLLHNPLVVRSAISHLKLAFDWPYRHVTSPSYLCFDNCLFSNLCRIFLTCRHLLQEMANDTCLHVGLAMRCAHHQLCGFGSADSYWTTESIKVAAFTDFLHSNNPSVHSELQNKQYAIESCLYSCFCQPCGCPCCHSLWQGGTGGSSSLPPSSSSPSS